MKDTPAWPGFSGAGGSTGLMITSSVRGCARAARRPRTPAPAASRRPSDEGAAGAGEVSAPASSASTAASRERPTLPAVLTGSESVKARVTPVAPPVAPATSTKVVFTPAMAEKPPRSPAPYAAAALLAPPAPSASTEALRGDITSRNATPSICVSSGTAPREGWEVGEGVRDTEAVTDAEAEAEGERVARPVPWGVAVPRAEAEAFTERLPDALPELVVVAFMDHVVVAVRVAEKEREREGRAEIVCEAHALADKMALREAVALPVVEGEDLSSEACGVDVVEPVVLTVEDTEDDPDVDAVGVAVDVCTPTVAVIVALSVRDALPEEEGAAESVAVGVRVPASSAVGGVEALTEAVLVGVRGVRVADAMAEPVAAAESACVEVRDRVKEEDAEKDAEKVATLGVAVGVKTAEAVPTDAEAVREGPPVKEDDALGDPETLLGAVRE